MAQALPASSRPCQAQPGGSPSPGGRFEPSKVQWASNQPYCHMPLWGSGMGVTSFQPAPLAMAAPPPQLMVHTSLTPQGGRPPYPTPPPHHPHPGAHTCTPPRPAILLGHIETNMFQPCTPCLHPQKRTHMHPRHATSGPQHPRALACSHGEHPFKHMPAQPWPEPPPCACQHVSDMFQT